MTNEAAGRAICVALELDPDQSIPLPPDPLNPAAHAAQTWPRWAVAAMLAERQRVLASA